MNPYSSGKLLVVTSRSTPLPTACKALKLFCAYQEGSVTVRRRSSPSYPAVYAVFQTSQASKIAASPFFLLRSSCLPYPTPLRAFLCVPVSDFLSSPVVWAKPGDKTGRVERLSAGRHFALHEARWSVAVCARTCRFLLTEKVCFYSIADGRPKIASCCTASLPPPLISALNMYPRKVLRCVIGDCCVGVHTEIADLLFRHMCVRVLKLFDGCTWGCLTPLSDNRPNLIADEDRFFFLGRVVRYRMESCFFHYILLVSGAHALQASS